VWAPSVWAEWYFLALAEPRKVVADPDGMVEVDAL
jgi:hypothetical protein